MAAPPAAAPPPAAPASPGAPAPNASADPYAATDFLPITRQEIVDAAVWSFENRLDEGFALSAEEQSRGESIVVADAKDSTARLAGFHADEQAPDYQPQLVEETVRRELPESTHDILGIVDLITDKPFRKIAPFPVPYLASRRAASSATFRTTLAYLRKFSVLILPPFFSLSVLKSCFLSTLS